MRNQGDHRQHGDAGAGAISADDAAKSLDDLRHEHMAVCFQREAARSEADFQHLDERAKALAALIATRE